ncbi:hypothetical protein [Virgibacillus sp. DJP39]|uniref:hypothetical protein n=1 Tax=Virgibacillus sp. DJP39 TaxID=3409790 RepID=UPI003BB7B9FA
MKKTLVLTLCLLFVFSINTAAETTSNKKIPEPKIKVTDGMTQAVFSKEEAIRETVYIETTVDSDGDGQNDRVHAEVVRPKETEERLEIPVIYE